MLLVLPLSHPATEGSRGCLSPCCSCWLMGGMVSGLGRTHQGPWGGDTHWTPILLPTPPTPTQDLTPMLHFPFAP